MLLSFAGRRIYYDLTGAETAPTICFTHSLASDSGMWAEQMQVLLAAGFRVLRIDMRGHGGSDPVAGDYSMAGLADDVASVLETLALPRVHYIGLSIGGMIGQGLAVRHGARLASMMLCDTLPGTLPGASEAWAPRLAVARQGSLAPLAGGTMERWFTDAFKAKSPRRWQQVHDTIAGTHAGAFVGCAAAILDFDYTAELPKLALPTLVVCGAEDQGTPPAENRRLASLVPGARYAEIAAARHLPNVEQDEAFNRIMMGWLAEQRG